MSEARGLRFECTQCGRCCTSRGEYTHVYLNRDEVRALADDLGLSTRAFRRRHTFRDEYGWTQLAFRDDRCAFLADDLKTCTVYSARPTQCRTFPFWRELVVDGRWTDEARALCEGVDRGPEWDPAEVEARMRAFEESEED